MNSKGYWVTAIAARPSSTHKGYLLGGLVWFAVPFSLATSLGICALALDLLITTSEADHGLVLASTAIALTGKGGSVLLLTMLFMLVTSAGSSELIAVSSLCTYDIYQTYINPNATGKQILKVSRIVVFGFGCFMGVLAIILNTEGLSLGWMYLSMGVFIGPVLPIVDGSSCSKPNFNFLNPLYLILSFVVYLVSKALWMQQDIGEFFNNPVSALVSVSTRSLLNLMETLQQFFGGEQVHQHTGPPAPSSSLLGSQSFSSQTQFSNPMTSAVAAETLRTHDKCSN